MINFLPDIAKYLKEDRFESITNVLKQNGIPYIIEPVNYSGIGNNAPMGNIVVPFIQNPDEKTLVVSAHYDISHQYCGTPGANDNGAACSILLNLILDVAEKGCVHNVTFVFFDLEEARQVGSGQYLNKHRTQIGAVINLDMCGQGKNTVVSLDNGIETMIPPIPTNVSILKRLPPSDGDPFIVSGVPTMLVINSTEHDLSWFEEYSMRRMPHEMPDFGRTMHMATDVPALCNLAQMENIHDFIRNIIFS